MKKAWIGIVGKQALICIATAYLFFHSWWSLPFLLPYFIYGLFRAKKEQLQKETELFAAQFRDGLQCLLASLEAGYSIENSFVNAAEDLLIMFRKEAPIVRSFRQICRQLGNGANVEELVFEMGEKSGVEDVRNFAGIFVTAKRTGGDLLGVIRSVNASLYQKQEVQREIASILLAKQLEVKIMRLMPYGILLYFQVFSPSFLMPLYAGFFGRMIMLIIFVLYLGCCFWADKMAAIDI